MGIFDLKPSKKQEPTRADEPEDALPSLEDQIIAAIREVYDPEIPVNIYDMGLIYKVDIEESSGKVHVDMTLTSPHCPAAQDLPIDVRNAVESVPGVSFAEVEIVWEPPWGPEQMSEAAKLELGMF